MVEILNMQIEYKLVLEKANKMIHGKLKSRNSSLHSIQNDYESISGNQPFGRSKTNQSNEEIKEEDIVLNGRLSGGSSRLDLSYREVSIKYIAGTIESADVERFKRILFRSLRGKVLTYFDEADIRL